MGLPFLEGRTWAEVTREERFFCQRLYELIRSSGPALFVSHVNEVCGTRLPVELDWEPAYEACFYRDLWHVRGRQGPLFSPKRTFDLCLFSNDIIVIVEAKADQPFDLDQLVSFAADREQVIKETGVSQVVLIGLASSRYSAPASVLEVFDGPLLTWNALASLYQNDRILLRADSLYDSERVTAWGKNNCDGYMTGEQLMAACHRGEKLWVGRGGGITGPCLRRDIETGGWRTQTYETNRTSPSCPNRNWFSLEEFARLVLGGGPAES